MYPSLRNKAALLTEMFVCVGGISRENRMHTYIRNRLRLSGVDNKISIIYVLDMPPSTNYTWRRNVYLYSLKLEVRLFMPPTFVSSSCASFMCACVRNVMNAMIKYFTMRSYKMPIFIDISVHWHIFTVSNSFNNISSTSANGCLHHQVWAFGHYDYK